MIFAVSIRNRSFREGVRDRLVTVGVLSSFIYSSPGQHPSVNGILRMNAGLTSRSALLRSLFGTFLALWLAVLLRMCLGTC